MRLDRRSTLMLGAGLLLGRPGLAAPAAAGARHGLSLLGEPALPPGFPHFPWANPDAPKGGTVSLGAIGGFDSYNPFVLRGTAAPVNAIWDTLMVSNPDEPAASYCHLARSVEISPDRSRVVFELRPEARFHDGTPITARDVAWTFDALRAKGRPFYRLYYADVVDAAADGDHRVVFRLKPTRNAEIPSILGELPALPRHWWKGRDFAEPVREAPVGSGAYRIGRSEPGRTLVLERVADHWARDLPTARGLHNFGELRTEYFRDATVALQAFKAGQIDFREEYIAKDWATGYDFPARRAGLVKCESIPQHLPTGLQGFAMNARRRPFDSRAFRTAMAWAYDFEWANKTLFYGAYTRTRSYFGNTDLAATGLPGPDEAALLEPHRATLPPELFTTEFALPVTDGSGNNHEALKRSLDMLRGGGFVVRDRVLNDPDGRPVRFEILLDNAAYERVALPYVRTLSRLGIEARVRTVDPAQYQRLTDAFDYDMIMIRLPATAHPGNEQRDYWSSAAARTEGSNNVTGTASPVVDELIDRIVGAADYPTLRAACRALDRVLLWDWRVVPQWYLDSVRAAYWNRFGRPTAPVRPGVVFDSWWVEPALARATDAARKS